MQIMQTPYSVEGRQISLHVLTIYFCWNRLQKNRKNFPDIAHDMKENKKCNTNRHEWIDPVPPGIMNHYTSYQHRHPAQHIFHQVQHYSPVVERSIASVQTPGGQTIKNNAQHSHPQHSLGHDLLRLHESWNGLR